MTEFDWAQTSFTGTRRRQARTLYSAGPAERLALLEELLELARASGALARVRAARQIEVDAAWRDS